MSLFSGTPCTYRFTFYIIRFDVKTSMKECLLKMAEQLNVQEKEKKDLNQWLYIFTKVGTILFLSSKLNSCFIYNFFRGLCQI